MGGDVDLGGGARLLPAEGIGNLQGEALGDAHKLGVAAARDETHDAVAGGETLDARARFDDLAGVLEAGDLELGPGAGLGIAAHALEHVGAIEGAGAHGDE